MGAEDRISRNTLYYVVAFYFLVQADVKRYRLQACATDPRQGLLVRRSFARRSRPPQHVDRRRERGWPAGRKG
jgi:hypothetical protein